jgi:hypothetical protein
MWHLRVLAHHQRSVFTDNNKIAKSHLEPKTHEVRIFEERYLPVSPTPFVFNVAKSKYKQKTNGGQRLQEKEAYKLCQDSNY